MPWDCVRVTPCRVEVEKPDPDCTIAYTIYRLPDGREVRFDGLPVGAMWHSSEVPPDAPSWERREGRKPSICVVLPGRVIWRMNDPPTNNPNGGWAVTGEIPNVSATPSINFVGTYHGYVTGGKVTDDVDGRKFDQHGRPL